MLHSCFIVNLSEWFDDSKQQFVYEFELFCTVQEIPVFGSSWSAFEALYDLLFLFMLKLSVAQLTRDIKI